MGKTAIPETRLSCMARKSHYKRRLRRGRWARYVYDVRFAVFSLFNCAAKRRAEIPSGKID